MIQILDYQIPSFKSIAWVSDNAKAVWQRRFQEINHAVINTSLQAVKEKELENDCLMIYGKWYNELKHELNQLNLEAQIRPVGKHKGSLRYFEASIMKKKEGETLVETKPSSRKETIWEAALTSGERTNENTLLLNSDTNKSVFWQKILVTFGKQHRKELSSSIDKEQLAARTSLMEKYGYAREALWLNQIYSWPVEWSSYHGICEVRTPVLKISYDTDPLAEKHIVQVEGTSYPEEGTFGKQFPYKRRKFQRITDSKSFKNGLANKL